MTILQSWSGGFDSTYLLCKNINEKNKVYPVYVDCGRVDTLKRVCEKKAIKEIYERLNNESINYYRVSEVFINSYVHNRYSYQPFLWLLGLFNEVVAMPEVQFDQVHIGYIMNDDALSFQEDLKEVWKNLFKFDYEVTINNKKIPELVFPLRKMGKDIILRGLKAQGILDLCWSCESPMYTNGQFHYCGDCTPCKHLKEAIQYADEAKLPKFDRMFNRLKVVDPRPYSGEIIKTEFESTLDMDKNYMNYCDKQLFLDFGYLENKTLEIKQDDAIFAKC